MKVKNILAVAGIGMLTAFSVSANINAKPEKDPPFKDAVTKNVTSSELHRDLRKLWIDHVAWTRNVILCIIDDLAGTDEALKRLQKNQDEIGSAIKPYYGDDAAKKLADLLHTHINQAGEILKATKQNDKAQVDLVNKKWKDNGNEIATFLSNANPNLKPEEMKKMMQQHLSLLLDEANARKKKDYSADVTAYDKTVDEILEMSDMISDGIVKQFPDKFKSEKEVGTK